MVHGRFEFAMPASCAATFEAGPRGLRWLVEPIVRRAFDRETHRRFARLRDFLALHGDEVEAAGEAGVAR